MAISLRTEKGPASNVYAPIVFQAIDFNPRLLWIRSFRSWIFNGDFRSIFFCCFRMCRIDIHGAAIAFAAAIAAFAAATALLAASIAALAAVIAAALAVGESRGGGSSRRRRWK